MSRRWELHARQLELPVAALFLIWALLATASPALAQAWPALPPANLATRAWLASSPSIRFNSAADSSSVQLTRDKPSAARTLTIHGLVGTSTGLLLGLVLSSASVSGDETAVVLTWTGVGAAAGLLSGLVTWLLERGE